MTASFSMRRIFILVLISLLLSALVTMGFYSAVSPRIFANVKQQELYPRVEYLAGEAASTYEEGSGFSELQPFLLDPQLWGATVSLINTERFVVATNDSRHRQSEYSDAIRNYDYKEVLDKVLAGKEITSRSYMLMPQEGEDENNKAVEILLIGIPVFVGDVVRGAVIMIKPIHEIVSSMNTLSATLWFSSFAVMGAMMPLIYWLSRKLARPMRQMRQVALRMAAGDFSIRANDGEVGEIGDMARAMNHLADELGRTINELTRERNQAVTIVNALSEGVLSLNTDGVLMMTNPAMQSMMTAAGRGSGRQASMPPEVWEAFCTALQKNRRVEGTMMLGEMRIHMTITPIIDPYNRRISAVGVFRDETQAFRLEQTRRDYVANVSHELRTPLTAVRALIEPLRDGLIRTEEKRQETYGVILRETMRLSRLVDDMLELSRLQSGKIALEKVRFHVDTLLHDTASIYETKARESGHRLVVDLGGDTQLPSVFGNPDRTEQVLVALLNNAFLHTPAGSVIALNVERKPDHLRITVEDTGPGISDEDLPHVFERFYKADKSHTGNGTGLGLAIAQELMERLGETISVENRPEGGARFSFTIHYGE